MGYHLLHIGGAAGPDSAPVGRQEHFQHDSSGFAYLSTGVCAIFRGHPIQMTEISRQPPLRVILTGATGMVGEGVLTSCLQQDSIAAVLVMTRRPLGETHPKLREIIVPDFGDLSAIEQDLSGYDACYFCAGVTSIGKSEAEYTLLTHTLTLNVAETLARRNPQMVFCYVSGMGTDTTEAGKLMWARVKGRTENDLQKLPFRDVYLFRPGFLTAGPGARRTLKLYRYLKWLAPVIRLVAPGHICSLDQLARAMIGVTLHGYEKPVLEVRDVLKVSGK